MVKLTDSQLIILSTAVARDDGLAVFPAKMNKASAAKVGLSLVARKLMREVKAKPEMPVWRRDNDGRPLSLMITKDGQKAIGIEGAEAAEKDDGEKNLSSKKRAEARAPKEQTRYRAAHSDPAATPRAGSKQALVISMLSGKSGTTLDALVEATGWLPHTTRAALTGLRKKGFPIERMREKDASVYRISGGASTRGA